MPGWCGAESRSSVSDQHGALSKAAELADLRDRDLELAKSRAAAEVAAAEPAADPEALTKEASAESAAEVTADAPAAQPEELPVRAGFAEESAMGVARPPMLCDPIQSNR